MEQTNLAPDPAHAAKLAEMLNLLKSVPNHCRIRSRSFAVSVVQSSGLRQMSPKASTTFFPART